MPARTIAEERRRLLDYGMTPEEVEIWLALGKVAGTLLKLPTLHPNEQEETVRDIHNLQNRLLARVGLRALGWGQ
ncbi:hypothetical protein [Meiothermus hypogaeus]|uniref:HTH merR-type domain-containing protein n=2 Tax=Meiothermus hypogaeus TaxID=884155 RepID=A0A511R6D9_9DEIN|nr:hypothetical protein [Meiothermus hypogaeus]RIH76949.1 hypothetical protein Mhypo_02203 [Meiothermus hypogaeus]GEM85183.1 hypothetical protein MHY01S_33490 [Meiothermus hypogaeus NBRC 106114]